MALAPEDLTVLVYRTFFLLVHERTGCTEQLRAGCLVFAPQLDALCIAD
jgi:hypothetical protein